MELVRTITDTLAMVRVEIVEKIDRGQSLEGYYIVKVLPEDGQKSPFHGMEISVFDDFFYTNTEFLRKGFKVKGALKLLGGYTGERAQPGEKVFKRRDVERTWEGYEVQGPLVHDSYLGPIMDVGIPLHCHYLLASNVPVIERWKRERIKPDMSQLDIPKKGDWVRMVGGLYIYLLKELELRCSSCRRERRYLTTSLPTGDELAGMLAVCRQCGNEQPANALPDICERCRKKMWQWKGKSVEFPLDCECGSTRYDFSYDHRPVFIES